MMRQMPVVVRQAEQTDLQALAELDRLSVEQRSVTQITYPLPGVDLLDLVKSNGHPDASCYVAVDETGQIAGFAFADLERVSWNGGEEVGAYLFHFRVHPDHRRRGVGRALVEHAETAALAAGARLTWVAVVQGNGASRAFFRNIGYVYGSRVEYAAVPLRLPPLWRPGWSGSYAVQPLAGESVAEVERLQEQFWRDHQLWAPRRHDLASRRFVALDGEGRAVASAVCFEHYRVAGVRTLGMGGLPALVNRLLASLANRAASRFVFARDLAFLDSAAALDLLSWLVATYGKEADFLVVGADARSEAQRAIRKLPGLPGWVDVLVKTSGLDDDGSRPYHMVLG